MDYPQLIEITTCDDTQRCFMMDIGVEEADLTEEEKRVLQGTERDHTARLKKKLSDVMSDLEQLRDIKNLPDEAVEILKRWTTRPEDWDEGEFEG